MTDTAPSQPGTPPVATAEGGLGFACPRCHRDVTERFYGPCPACRRELRAAAGQAGDTETAAFEAAPFEPRMHVTPNAVATRD